MHPVQGLLGRLEPSARRRDLAAIVPGIELLDLCADGATIGHTLDARLIARPG